MGKYIDWYINILWLYYSSKWWTGQKGTVYVIKDFIKKRIHILSILPIYNNYSSELTSGE